MLGSGVVLCFFLLMFWVLVIGLSPPFHMLLMSSDLVSTPLLGFVGAETLSWSPCGDLGPLALVESDSLSFYMLCRLAMLPIAVLSRTENIATFTTLLFHFLLLCFPSFASSLLVLSSIHSWGCFFSFLCLAWTFWFFLLGLPPLSTMEGAMNHPLRPLCFGEKDWLLDISRDAKDTEPFKNQQWIWAESCKRGP